MCPSFWGFQVKEEFCHDNSILFLMHYVFQLFILTALLIYNWWTSNCTEVRRQWWGEGKGWFNSPRTWQHDNQTCSQEMAQARWVKRNDSLNQGRSIAIIVLSLKVSDRIAVSSGLIILDFLSLIFTSKTVSCTLICRSWMTSWTSPSQSCHSDTRLYLKRHSCLP